MGRSVLSMGHCSGCPLSDERREMMVRSTLALRLALILAALAALAMVAGGSPWGPS